MGDPNGDGVIEPSELEDLLRQSGFQFDDNTIAAIMTGADTNRDGVIEYKEFVPLMTALLSDEPAMEVNELARTEGRESRTGFSQVPPPNPNLTPTDVVSFPLLAIDSRGGRGL